MKKLIWCHDGYRMINLISNKYRCLSCQGHGCDHCNNSGIEPCPLTMFKHKEVPCDCVKQERGVDLPGAGRERTMMYDNEMKEREEKLSKEQFVINISKDELELIHKALKHYANCKYNVKKYSDVELGIIKDRATYFYGKLQDYNSR